MRIPFISRKPKAIAAQPSGNSRVRQVMAFDAGKSARRLKALPTAQEYINAQIQRYGRTLLARSRYLCANNPYASSAKAAFVAALVGYGIKPSSKATNASLKKAIHQLWLDWTDEADADNLTDFYGLQDIAASEMFEAGECFVRIRPRRESDGLLIPFQLQILPSEMLPYDKNENFPGRNRIEMGIEFDGIGRRVAYHFLRNHPGNPLTFTNETTRVPASEVIHLFRPFVAGQIRGIPHSVAVIARLALLDQYDDAELERKKTAALFCGFNLRPPNDADAHPLETDDPNLLLDDYEDAIGLEPGLFVDLPPGHDVKFAAPADVGGNYDPFQYRNLTAIAAGFGVPYLDMTGDTSRANYSSMRSGQLMFKRRILPIQNGTVIFQFCRPIWIRFFDLAVLNQLLPIDLVQYSLNPLEFRRVAWIPPKWDWVDPAKDIAAEKNAIRSGLKTRASVVAEQGEEIEDVDEQNRQDKQRVDAMGLVYDTDPRNVSNAGVTQARNAEFDILGGIGDEPSETPEEEEENAPSEE